MGLERGHRLGPYEILDAIGAGGMGEVYRARDTRLDRVVAIKILAAKVADRPDLQERFELEARAVSSLNHPNICVLHDIGRENGVSYFVMEFLEGETLSQRIAKGPIPVDQALRIAIDIASALDRAHRQGIVHRDLKPGNVMLTKTGTKLVDFGLARLAGAPKHLAEDVSRLQTEQKDLTGEGKIAGTIQYMAPEQLEGKDADARTDIFAFGALLYEMLSGRRAFPGKSQASVIAAILSSEPPPVSTVQPVTPPGLDRLIRGCLAKDPDDRWHSLHDLIANLKWIAEAGSQAGVPVPVTARRRHRERIAWSIAGISALAALASIAVALRRPPAVPERVLRSAILMPEGGRFDPGLEAIASIVLSPDGKNVVFSAAGKEGKPMLWLRPLDAPTARPLPGTEEGACPFWSPDGRQIAFFSGSKLKKVDLAGTPPSVICAAPQGRSGSWSREGVIVFSPGATSPIHRVSASGGEPAPVTELDAKARETTHRWATFLPDGKHFLFLAGGHQADPRDEVNAIYAGSIDSMERKLVVRARSNPLYVSGRLLYVRDRVLLSQSFDPGSLSVTGEPVPVATTVAYSADLFRAGFTATEDVLAYLPGAAEAHSQLTWVDRSGRETSTVGEPGDFNELALSDDDKRIAYSQNDPDSGASDIWILDLERSSRSRLTFGGKKHQVPVWSPDGRRIAYGGSNGLWLDLYVKPSSGGGAEEALVVDESDKYPSDWSSDGRFLAFHRERLDSPTKSDIWILPMEGERKPSALVATAAEEKRASFSPDGRWVVYESDESGRPEVYATSIPGAKERLQISSAGGEFPRWIGEEILYVSGQSLISVPAKAGPAGIEIGAPATLFKFPNAVGGTMSLSGRRFLLAVVPQLTQAPPITLVTSWTAGLPR